MSRVLEARFPQENLENVVSSPCLCPSSCEHKEGSLQRRGGPMPLVSHAQELKTRSSTRSRKVRLPKDPVPNQGILARNWFPRETWTTTGVVLFQEHRHSNSATELKTLSQVNERDAGDRIILGPTIINRIRTRDKNVSKSVDCPEGAVTGPEDIPD